jgi:biopolymer transport protein ExbB/TolQ
MHAFAPPLAAAGYSIPQILGDTGAFGLVSLAVLTLASIASWGVMFERWRFFRQLDKKVRDLKAVIRTRGLSSALAESESYLPSVEAAVLNEAQMYLGNRGIEGQLVLDDRAHAEAERARLRALLEGRASSQFSVMERYLILLSTVASASPFLGLLATVWGIMHSFLAMAGGGTASIDVVGPGIAEALVGTIAGLGAAIPALVGYNMFVRRVQKKESEIDLFLSRVVEYLVAVRGEEHASMDTNVRTSRKSLAL